MRIGPFMFTGARTAIRWPGSSGCRQLARRGTSGWAAVVFIAAIALGLLVSLFLSGRMRP